MNKTILFGTTNQAKVDIMRELFKPLPVSLVSLKDLDIIADVEEDGSSPEANALKKAKSYFALSKIPTFAIDSGLYIDAFPENKQPGIFVRRIYGANTADVSDEEMREYYVQELHKVGGTSVAKWNTAVALVCSPKKFFTHIFERKTILTAQASNLRVQGFPLDSLQIDPTTGKYRSEMTIVEKAKILGQDSLGIFEFLKEHIFNT